jgi:endonuclease/exonuclease/phosphatase family metal-dependent hydrolase
MWFRLRATADSKWHDSVWAQYSDAIGAAAEPIYRIGTADAIGVNLEPCYNCGNAEWGWQDGLYWRSQTTTIRFAASGSHTLRIQTREDGVQLDQVVLSQASYLSAPPGPVRNDTTFVPKQVSDRAIPTPYYGSPVAIPGTIAAENFDEGGEGIAYHDSTPGNSGGAYRMTDVDIERSSEGAYDVGWTTPGEWLNYSVTVATAANYVVQLRLATPAAGRSLHIGFNGSGVWTVVPIPATGAWQTWTTVNVPVTLAAGPQLLTVLFDTGGVNLQSITVVRGTVAVGASPVVVTWNIENIYSEGHARAAMDYLTALSPTPEIIVIQEAYQEHFAAFVDELQRRTGKVWYGAFSTHCPPAGWNGTTCTISWSEGVGIFSTFPIVQSSTAWFPFPDCWTSARTGLRAALDVGGVTLQVFALHLQTGACSNAAQARYNSMASFKQWASQYSTPQIVGGDFNADPDQIASAAGMSGNFVDSWSVVGSGRGLTSFTPAPTMKLDYLFADASAKAQPLWSNVVTTTGTVSDHYPLAAAFVIRP